MISIFIATAAGLTAGNFIYQLFGPRDFRLAAERSFYQIAAIATVGAVLAIRSIS